MTGSTRDERARRHRERAESLRPWQPAIAAFLALLSLALGASMASATPAGSNSLLTPDLAGAASPPPTPRESATDSRHKKHRAGKQHKVLRIDHVAMRHAVKTVSATQTRSISGSADVGLTLTLRPGAPALHVGSPVIERPSAKAPDGVLGVVIAVDDGPGGVQVAHLRPAALSEIFKSLDITASGSLDPASVTAASVRSHAAGVGPLNPHFKCSGAAPTPHIDVDLSAMRYSFDLSIPNSINVFIGGTPSFSLGFNFPAQVTCSGSLTARIPLGSTGLFLEIGPQFSITAGGLASAAFTWKPKLTFAFFRSRTGSGNFDIHQFTNQGSIEFGGSASIGAQLALKVGVSAGGRVGRRWHTRTPTG